MRNRVVYLCLVCLLCACNTPSSPKVVPYQKISGKTMGTSYNVTYQGGQVGAIKEALAFSLREINEGASTYDPRSVISLFNQSSYGLDLRELTHTHSSGSINHFKENLTQAQMIHHQTDGYFDATVMPLVNYWGFGYTGRDAVEKMDEDKIKSLLNVVGMDKVSVKDSIVKKNISGIQLDFSAIAKGYAVDELGRVLEGFGVENYFVEIGGEVFTKGLNRRGQKWVLGINVPDVKSSTKAIFRKVKLSNQGLATSGDYRNFFEVDGKKYGHSINPKSGKPESELLSVSVLAPNCMLADAYATAFMVMGKERALPLAESLEGIEAYFIYEGQTQMNTVATSGFNLYLIY